VSNSSLRLVSSVHACAFPSLSLFPSYFYLPFRLPLIKIVLDRTSSRRTRTTRIHSFAFPTRYSDRSWTSNFVRLFVFNFDYCFNFCWIARTNNKNRKTFVFLMRYRLGNDSGAGMRCEWTKVIINVWSVIRVGKSFELHHCIFRQWWISRRYIYNMYLLISSDEIKKRKKKEKRMLSGNSRWWFSCSFFSLIHHFFDAISKRASRIMRVSLYTCSLITSQAAQTFSSRMRYNA
jgi:hypothetical protein